MDRVLLTGATGFVGSHCLQRLLSCRPTQLHAVNRRGTGPGGPEVHWHSADLCNPAEAEHLVKQIRPTHILHCAWIAKPGVYAGSDENLAWLEASISLFRAFGSIGGEHVVGVGSSAEYDPQAGQPCREDHTALNPQSAYGKCKLSCWIALQAAAQAYGFSAAWGRVFLPYGPGDPAARLIPSVLESLLARRPIDLTHGTQIRDFIYAPDAAGLLVDLLRSNVHGAYNIGTGQGNSVRSAIERLAQMVDAVDCAKFGARSLRSREPSYLVADMTKIREQFGNRTIDSLVSLDAGLQSVIGAAKSRN